MIDQEPKASREAPLSDRQLLEEVHQWLVELRPLLEAVKQHRAIRSFLGMK